MKIAKLGFYYPYFVIYFGTYAYFFFKFTCHRYVEDVIEIKYFFWICILFHIKIKYLKFSWKMAFLAFLETTKMHSEQNGADKFFDWDDCNISKIIWEKKLLKMYAQILRYNSLNFDLLHKMTQFTAKIALSCKYLEKFSFCSLPL